MDDSCTSTARMHSLTPARPGREKRANKKEEDASDISSAHGQQAGAGRETRPSLPVSCVPKASALGTCSKHGSPSPHLTPYSTPAFRWPDKLLAL